MEGGKEIIYENILLKALQKNGSCKNISKNISSVLTQRNLSCRWRNKDEDELRYIVEDGKDTYDKRVVLSMMS